MSEPFEKQTSDRLVRAMLDNPALLRTIVNSIVRDASHEAGHESPIENLFVGALSLYARGIPEFKFLVERGPHRKFSEIKTADIFRGDTYRAVCIPQVHVLNYRMDFLVAVRRSDNVPMFLDVECDGHDFHERTKEQATGDKARDRKLQAQGIEVHRFTGSEIWRDPIAAAWEVVLRATDEEIKYYRAKKSA